MVRTLSTDEARAFYDRFGARQDSQAFYEDLAITDLIAHSEFETAQAVFEFGCGTGRFAERLLTTCLPPTCTYLAVDISSTMVRLAESRLARWRDRAEVVQTSGTIGMHGRAHRFDRFVANYVLDLLSDEDIQRALVDARRLLSPEGHACLVSLTDGVTPWPKLVTWLWRRIHAVSPKLVGGCRPIGLRDYLSPDEWRVGHRAVVSSFGISSEIIVARPR